MFKAMHGKSGWEDLVTDEVTYQGPMASIVKGKDAFIGITNQFLQNMHQGKVRSMIVEDDGACVLTSYQLGNPDVALLDLDACEILKVKDGKVDSFETYFDSLKLSSFMEKMQKQ